MVHLNLVLHVGTVVLEHALPLYCMFMKNIGAYLSDNTVSWHKYRNTKLHHLENPKP